MVQLIGHPSLLQQRWKRPFTQGGKGKGKKKCNGWEISTKKKTRLVEREKGPNFSKKKRNLIS